MIILLMLIVATALTSAALVAGRRCISAVAGLIIWLMIVFILIFNSSAVVRTVAKSALPGGSEEDGFLLGIRLMATAMWESYFSVIYLSFLLLIIGLRWKSLKKA